MEPSVATTSLAICIDAIEDGRLRGAICSSLLPKTIDFDDLGRGILRADEAMNGNCFPQAYMRLRTFDQEAPVPPAIRLKRVIPERAGEIATFTLRIRARRRAEWQGVLSGPDGSIEFFTSILGLLRIIERQLEKLLPIEAQAELSSN